jgi:23S rRNA (uracil1939-C5)-methyltransferase
VAELILQIVDLNHEARGVAKLDGKAVFVDGGLPGDTVRAQIYKRNAHFDQAQILQIVTPSPARTQPPCAHFGLCAGCSLQHMSADAQILAKQNWLLENLSRIARIEPEQVIPPLRSAEFGYRRKARLSARFVEKKNRLLIGFRETNGRYVADVERCAVLVPQIDERLPELNALLSQLDCKRDIPQLEVAAADNAVAVVIRHMKPMNEPDQELLIAYAKQSGVQIYLQPAGVDSVAPLWPQDPELFFELGTGRVRLDFRPLDFIQVNAALNQQLVVHALDAMALQPNDNALDLFCGLGNFSLPMAQRCAQVTAVEGERSLIDRARQNAARNNLQNVDFHVADLFASQQGADWLAKKFDAVLLDPPRAGAEQFVNDWPFSLPPKKVVYVSCQPSTLARDVAVLSAKHGYKLRRAGVLDMFPHTSHVESMAVLEKDS